MILDEGESQESAEVRMREVWARSLGWTKVSKELVGGEENEVVSFTLIVSVSFTFR